LIPLLLLLAPYDQPSGRFLIVPQLQQPLLAHNDNGNTKFPSNNHVERSLLNFGLFSSWKPREPFLVRATIHAIYAQHSLFRNTPPLTIIGIRRNRRSLSGQRRADLLFPMQNRVHHAKFFGPFLLYRCTSLRRGGGGGVGWRELCDGGGWEELL
jgi:hypothetical protein